MKSASLVRTLYRALLKECNKSAAAYPEVQSLFIRAPFTGEVASFNPNATSGAVYLQQATEQLVPGLEVPPEQPRLSWQDVKKLIRANFDANKAVGPDQLVALSNQAFAALRSLPEQVYLEASSSTTSTVGVVIEATSCLSAKDPAAGVSIPGYASTRHFFIYRVRIMNTRSHPVKVLGRGWTIKNDDGRLEGFVELSPSNGIVGQQPVIPAGGCFEYYSGAHLSSSSGQTELPSGSMTGMMLVDVYEEDSGQDDVVERVQVPVGPFRLMAPERFAK